MSDNILSAVLTFGLLASGTAAIGSEMFNTHRAPVQEATKVVMLPAVTITGHRETQVVMLPAVTITGHRDAVLALADGAASPATVR